MVRGKTATTSQVPNKQRETSRRCDRTGLITPGTLAVRAYILAHVSFGRRVVVRLLRRTNKICGQGRHTRTDGRQQKLRQSAQDPKSEEKTPKEAFTETFRLRCVQAADLINLH